MKQDILICGVGGQGTVLASKILAASAMDEGYAVHSAETIGMAQRGGPVTSHVRIGEGAYSPLIPLGGADLLIAFEPSEAVRNLKFLKQDGFVLFNTVPVHPSAGSRPENYDGIRETDYLRSRFRCLAIDSVALCAPLGSSRFFNVAVLGAAVGAGMLGLSADTVRKTVSRIVPERFRDKNLAAFEAGHRIGACSHADQ